MKYDKIAEALFLERPNRFVARVLLEGREETVHVKNTGRCRELLLPGRTKVYLEDCRGRENRKTGYSLIAAEKEGAALFPDAPTKRGVKHLEELIQARKAGYEAAVLFVIQMEAVKQFIPNWETHPAFAKALCRAAEAGVEILAYACRVTADSLVMDTAVPVCLTV